MDLERTDYSEMTQVQWDAFRADKLGEIALEMEDDFAAIAMLLGIEGEYHVSFGVETILEEIEKLRRHPEPQSIVMYV